MLVPLIVLVAVLLPIQVDSTSVPGAKISTTDPKLENDERLSLMSVAPTVQAVGSLAGE